VPRPIPPQKEKIITPSFGPIDLEISVDPEGNKITTGTWGWGPSTPMTIAAEEETTGYFNLGDWFRQMGNWLDNGIRDYLD
jgi:hypothetical protein